MTASFRSFICELVSWFSPKNLLIQEFWIVFGKFYCLHSCLSFWIRHWCQLCKGRQCKYQNVISFPFLHPNFTLLGSVYFVVPSSVCCPPGCSWYPTVSPQPVMRHGGIPSQFQGFAFELHEVFVSPFPQLVEITLRGEEIGEAWEQTLPIKSEAERNLVF